MWHKRLIKRLEELSANYPRYGYRRIVIKLREEGWQIVFAPVQRLRCAQGLRVPPSKRRRGLRGVSTGLPTQAKHHGHLESWDIISDSTTRGGALRMLTILDEYTRECHVLRAVREHGASQYLRCNSGPEFITKEVKKWLKTHQIKTIYIEPGSP